MLSINYGEFGKTKIFCLSYSKMHFRHIHQQIVSFGIHFVSNLESEQIITMATTLCLICGNSLVVTMFIVPDAPNRRLPQNVVIVNVCSVKDAKCPKRPILKLMVPISETHIIQHQYTTVNLVTANF